MKAQNYENIRENMNEIFIEGNREELEKLHKLLSLVISSPSNEIVKAEGICGQRVQIKLSK